MRNPLLQPDARALAALEANWSTCYPAGARVVGCTAFGDVFLLAPVGEVLWLNTGTAECSVVAGSLPDFEAALASEPADLWLLPRLVAALESEGKARTPGQCYTFAILPVFAEGRYEPWNFRPVPLWEHLEATAALHRQLEGLPDGARVRLRVQ